MNNYERMVLKRKKENKEFLKTLDLYAVDEKRADVQEKDSHEPKPKRVKRTLKHPVLLPSRKSNRILGKEPVKYDLLEEEPVTKSPVKEKEISKKRENSFGAIPGVEIGTEFATRLLASRAGIHKPPVAGIHGDPERGCYSLALSGGYEDDVDSGHTFVYTGEGGRDLKGTKANPKNLRTAPQSKDQVLERGNLALSRNIDNKLPVRVLRGYKLQSPFAPEEGYRYDGLYRVVKYYVTRGMSGFGVYKFLLERMEDQAPAPWEIESKENKTLSSEKENDAGTLENSEF